LTFPGKWRCNKAPHVHADGRLARPEQIGLVDLLVQLPSSSDS
jgi:hypothetical protein